MREESAGRGFASCEIHDRRPLCLVLDWFHTSPTEIDEGEMDLMVQHMTSISIRVLHCSTRVVIEACATMYLPHRFGCTRRDELIDSK